MANTKRTIEEILSTTGQQLTPYEVYRIWQAAAFEVDSTRELRPQMAYNYDRNGLIVKGRSSKQTGSAGRYTVQEALEFVSKWIMRNYKTQWPVATTEIDENAEVEGQLEMFEIEA